MHRPVEAIAAQKQPRGSIEQKVADFYTAYLDTAKINALGLAPFDADLADPDRYVLEVGQAGLGLPSRDYYLSADEAFVKNRCVSR